MSTPRRAYRAATLVLSLVMVGLGVAIVVSTVARGGGPLAVGIPVGALFVAAGVARLYLTARPGDG
jgi:hypothetical protein